MAREYILLVTMVYRSNDSVLKLRWEEPADIRSARKSGIVAYPTKSAIDLMLKHIGALLDHLKSRCVAMTCQRTTSITGAHPG
jgi:hypothetical protein